MINFITSNYTIILIIVMIIVFSIIGKYIDSIGFFASYKEEPEEEPKPEKAEEEIVETDDVLEPTMPNPDEYPDIDKALFAPIEGTIESANLTSEVDSILSKKDVIDDDLLSDIEHLSLDKTQRYNFGDIPDLDDVELPKIKKNEEPEDIWKF